MLTMVEVRTTTVPDAQSAGTLLGASGTSDVVGALLADATLPGDQVLTSDPDDLARLLAARAVGALVVRV
jgi:hypothetical protein